MAHKKSALLFVDTLRVSVQPRSCSLPYWYAADHCNLRLRYRLPPVFLARIYWLALFAGIADR